MQKEKKLRVAIIGAGITGLSNASHLLKSGYEVRVFEKQSAPGGIWNNLSNEGSYLQTSSLHYHFASGVRWRSKHPGRAEIREQIQRACAALPAGVVSFNTEVESVRFQKDGVLVTVAGEEGFYDGIIVATGLHQAPFTPENLAAFNGELRHFIEIDSLCDLEKKNVVIVGCGPSAMEAMRSLGPRAKSVHLVCDRPRWIYPSIGLYNLLIFLPFSLPNQLTDRFVGFLLRRHYAKYGLQHMQPATTPVRTSPGSIYKEFFPMAQRENIHLHPRSTIAGFKDKDVCLADGTALPDIDAIVACTGWQPLRFPFFDEELSAKVQHYIKNVGYLYLHEVVPGYPRLILANYKSGIGSTGLAPFISSVLLQNALEQAHLYPTATKQEQWVAAEQRRWRTAPHVFQSINVFESFVRTFAFFSHPLRIFWFLKKMSLRYIGKIPLSTK